MKILTMLWLLARRGFYDWALREIDPLHPDVNEVVMTRLQIEDELQLIWR